MWRCCSKRMARRKSLAGALRISWKRKKLRRFAAENNHFGLPGFRFAASQRGRFQRKSLGRGKRRQLCALDAQRKSNGGGFESRNLLTTVRIPGHSWNFAPSLLTHSAEEIRNGKRRRARLGHYFAIERTRGC